MFEEIKKYSKTSKCFEILSKNVHRRLKAVQNKFKYVQKSENMLKNRKYVQKEQIGLKKLKYLQNRKKKFRYSERFSENVPSS